MMTSLRKAHVKISLDRRKLRRATEKMISRRLRLIGEATVKQMRRNVNKDYHSKGPSQPGQFPHKRTGRLQGSIFWAFIRDDAIIVGSELDYAFWLETGTRKMAPRPFLMRTFIMMASRIERIWVRGR